MSHTLKWGSSPLRLLGPNTCKNPWPWHKGKQGYLLGSPHGSGLGHIRDGAHSHLLMVCLTGLSCRWMR